MVVSELPRWDLEFRFSPFLSEKFIQAIKKKFQSFFLFQGIFVEFFCKRQKLLKDANCKAA